MAKEEFKERGEVKEKGNEKNIEYYMGLPYSILLHQIEDDGEKFWIAEVPELPGCKSHGSTVDDAVKSVEEAKRDWIFDSLEKGEIVPTPVERDRFNGRILVRTSRSLHRSLSIMSEMEKLSLNQLIVTILAKEIGRLEVLNRVENKLDKIADRLHLIQESKSISMQVYPDLLDQEPFHIGQASTDDFVSRLWQYNQPNNWGNIMPGVNYDQLRKCQAMIVRYSGLNQGVISFPTNIQSQNNEMPELVINKGGSR